MRASANIPDPTDQRWSDILQAWPVVLRFFVQLDSALGEMRSVHPDPEPSLDLPLSRTGYRPPGRTSPPVSEIHIDEVEQHRLSDVLDQYAELKHLLTPKQWSAVYLHFGEGLTQAEIAHRMGLRHQSAVSNLLRRARLKKDGHERRSREEQFRLARKYRIPRNEA